MTGRPCDRLISPHARASARKRANADAETRREATAKRSQRTRRGVRLTAKRKGQANHRRKVIIPTPEEWAKEQLKSAPARSKEWARRVAQIYSLDIGDDKEEDSDEHEGS